MARSPLSIASLLAALAVSAATPALAFLAPPQAAPPHAAPRETTTTATATAIATAADPRATKPTRVAVIGASASAGFGCVLREARDDGNYFASFRLIDMVRLACPDLEIVSTDHSSGFFFLAPIANGTKAAARARAFEPDCILALDFLFWYCYGDDAPGGGALTEEAQRLAKFELGLAELAAFTQPVLVGDVPDMSRAVGKMLSRRQMPALETIRAANERLHAWAKDRANVRVLPLADMQRQLMEEGALAIAGARIEATRERPLLQGDDLHPAPLGMAGLACAVAGELKAAVCTPEQLEADTCVPAPLDTLDRARGSLRRSGPPRATPAAPASAPATERIPAGSSK